VFSNKYSGKIFSFWSIVLPKLFLCCFLQNQSILGTFGQNIGLKVSACHVNQMIFDRNRQKCSCIFGKRAEMIKSHHI
jgi:hypothetical protein